MVFQTKSLPWSITVGHWQSFSSTNLRSKMQRLSSSNLDFTIFPLFSNDHLSSPPLNLDLSSIPCEQDLSNTSHMRKIFLEINSLIDITNPQHRQSFQFIVGYAVYLGLGSLVIHIPDSKIIPDWIWELNKLIEKGLFGGVHIVFRVEFSEERADERWEDYIYVRKNINKRVYYDLMLELTGNIPSNEEKFLRWLPERIDYIVLPTSIFTTNNKGFPVLTHKHQQLLRKLFFHKTRIVLKDFENTDLTNYLKLIQYMVSQLQKKHETGHLAMKQFDFLQNPLQPYSDNLGSDTYTVFELDNAKYDEYQIALIDALNTFPQNYKVVIYYVGCGRGGLLFNCFEASKKTGRKINVYAIDKNPYPLQSVKKRVSTNKWGKSVDLVCQDAKTWQPKEEADICLSQLLGAFGDNELSPECLSWAEKHIWKPNSTTFKKQTICIPQSYTAYIAPLSYSCTHKVLNIADRQNYFTVNFHNCYRPSPIQAVWTFSHPLSEQQTFQRQSINIFKFTQSCLIHGFAGYFTSDLYGRGRLSILPEDHTQEMESWYPLFFSFKKEVRIEEGFEIRIEIRRRVGENRVWYQWKYEVWKGEQRVEESEWHNDGGNRHCINC